METLGVPEKNISCPARVRKIDRGNIQSRAAYDSVMCRGRENCWKGGRARLFILLFGLYIMRKGSKLVSQQRVVSESGSAYLSCVPRGLFTNKVSRDTGLFEAPALA